MNAGTGEEQGLEPAEIAVLALGRLRQGVRTRPLTTLAGIFGIGYVLGRGLPNVVVRLGSMIALRAVAARVLLRSLHKDGAAFGGATSGGDAFGEAHR
jgi:hypothetical protein